MSDTGGTEENIDYSKMKVNDLKQLLKTRGLSQGGNKQQLIERLQSNETPSEDLLDGSEVGDELGEELGDELERELDESSLLIGDDAVMEKTELKKDNKDIKPAQEMKDELATSSPTKSVVVDSAIKPAEEKPSNGSAIEQTEVLNTTTQQKRKISLKPESSTSHAAKKKLRAERFGAGGEDNPKNVLTKRAERFAANSTTTSTTAPSDKSKISEGEALKKRAERFGILSPAEQKKQLLEKLQARKLRFASTPVAKTTGTTPGRTTATATIAAVPVLPSGVKPTQLSVEERKKLRAQRFNTTK